MNAPAEIAALVRRGALFVVNHSAGKDSQAMMIRLAEIVPLDQMVVVHAELPGADWPGLREHIEATVPAGVPVHYCHAIFADGRTKTLLDMVRDRHAKLLAAGKDVSPWPSPQQRQCTSDLKRGPIEKVIRRIARERGCTLIVNCEGLRAEESSDRAKRPTFSRHAELSKAGREVYTWLPIHGLLEPEVFEAIAAAGQRPHWAYARGMRRLSCVFCIYASEEDHRTAAHLMPMTLAEYVAVERLTGKTLSMTQRTLEEITGVRLLEQEAA